MEREFVYSSIGIDDAHTLADYLSLKPIGETITVRCEKITIEAQNALLKAIEDLPSRTKVHFTHPDPHELLPTFRSRFVDIQRTDRTAQQIDMESFFNLSVAERLRGVSAIAESEEKAKVSAFLDSLEKYAYDRSLSRNKTILSEIVKARWRLSSSETPIRAILEHIILITHV